jgi:ribosomal protein L14
VGRSDNAGFLWLNLFFLYLWGLQRRLGVGYFFFASVRQLWQPTALYKGMRSRGILLRLRKRQQRLDGGSMRSSMNGGALLSTPWNFIGSRLLGFTVRELARPRILLKIRALL